MMAIWQAVLNSVMPPLATRAIKCLYLILPSKHIPLTAIVAAITRLAKCKFTKTAPLQLAILMLELTLQDNRQLLVCISILQLLFLFLQTPKFWMITRVSRPNLFHSVLLNKVA